MNKVLIVFTFLSILGSALTLKSPKQGLWQEWSETFFEHSKSRGDLILIKVVRDNCHYCRDMEMRVFKDAKMQAFIKENFIPSFINISHETMPLGLNVTMTPSFYFINSEKKVVKRIKGSWNKEDFSSFVQKILKAQ